MAKTDISHMSLALPLVSGVIPSIAGYQLVREWPAEGTALIVGGTLLLLTGATMLMSAFLLLVSLGRLRLPIWTGGISSLLSGGVLAAATISHVFPCSGST
jgi:hypothetical protein